MYGVKTMTVISPDIFQVQDEISNIIANRLRENLSLAAKKEHLVKPSTKNINAYTLYLKGTALLE
jgi:hypothetical protein